jgi:hypothetical protein
MSKKNYRVVEFKVNPMSEPKCVSSRTVRANLGEGQAQKIASKMNEAQAYESNIILSYMVSSIGDN